MQLPTQINKYCKSVVSFWRSLLDTIVRLPQYFPWQHFWKIIISNYLTCFKIILKIIRFLGIPLLKRFKQMQTITCYSKIGVHICFISTCNNSLCYYLCYFYFKIMYWVSNVALSLLKHKSQSTSWICNLLYHMCLHMN